MVGQLLNETVQAELSLPEPTEGIIGHLKMELLDFRMRDLAWLEVA